MGFMKIILYHLPLLLIAVLKYPINFEDEEIGVIRKWFEEDKNLCPGCFEDQWRECEVLMTNLTFHVDFESTVNRLLGVKNVIRARRAIGEEIVIKHLSSTERLARRLTKMYATDEETFKGVFFDPARIDGLQFCPQNAIDSFVRMFDRQMSVTRIWSYILVNVQLLLTPVLNRYNFPVPKSFGTCGLIQFESYDGQPLGDFLHHSFGARLEIARQLIEAALKFTEGFKGYKVYLTDVTADNVVFSERSRNISFVDLDDIIIVDSRGSGLLDSIHEHDHIECLGCFAYSAADICSHRESDFNIFVMCQFLREDLYQNKQNGYLHSIPEEHSVIATLLDDCLASKRTQSRFHIATQLLNAMATILK